MRTSRERGVSLLIFRHPISPLDPHVNRYIVMDGHLGNWDFFVTTAVDEMIGCHKMSELEGVNEGSLEVMVFM